STLRSGSPPVSSPRSFPTARKNISTRASGTWMTERRMTITAGVDFAIRAHGQQTYPHECCGALLGRDDRVIDLLALPNTTEEGPRRRFLVRPTDYQQAERRATELGIELLGFYHSHPDHPAR